jgi:anti-sigma regulatory factor (Ser/Thr protein kinase)
MNSEVVRPSGDLPTDSPATKSRRNLRIRLSATARGARLARRLAAQQLEAWDWPYDTDFSLTAVHLVAELAANAATHGRVLGRDFRLVVAGTGRRRGPADRGHRSSYRTAPARARQVHSAPPLAESGRGLLLVEALADRWGARPEPPCAKTVWRELALPGR